MLSGSNLSYKPFWGIYRLLNSWRANSPNPIQIYCVNKGSSSTLFKYQARDITSLQINHPCREDFDLRHITYIFNFFINSDDILFNGQDTNKDIIRSSTSNNIGKRNLIQICVI